MVTYAGLPAGRLPIFGAGRLGGFVIMSAFANTHRVGDDLADALLWLERFGGAVPIGPRGDKRLGLALETGARREECAATERTGMPSSMALRVGAWTPPGPLVPVYRSCTGGARNARLLLGPP